MAQFLWGGDSTQNLKSGRPIEARTEDMVKKIEDLVLSDRRMKLAFIAREIGISETIVWKVLHDDLSMKKVSAHWIPKLFTPEQKLVRKEISQENFIALQDHDSFFSQTVNGVYVSLGRFY
jgi:histone-lysine N-methyltransferase SETMAR